MLILAGADPAAKTDEGETAEEWARLEGAEKTLKEIVECSEVVMLRSAESKRNADVRKLREEEQRPFDKDGNGDVDHALLSEYIEARHKRRIDEQGKILGTLTARLDTDGDGKISRSEAGAILADFQKLDALPHRNKGYSLKRRELYLAYFDNNGDSVISDVENEVAYAFLRESRAKRADSESIRIAIIWPQL